MAWRTDSECPSGGDLYSTFSLQPAVPPGGITSLQWKNTGSGQDTLPAVSLSHEKPWEFAYPQMTLFVLSHFPAQPSQQLFLSAPPAFSSSGRNGSLSQTPENTPCKQTDLESYTQQMWHTWWPRSPQQVHPHLPQQRRSESPRGLHLWSAARCCRGRAPRWTAHSPPRCGLPPSASRTDLLGSHLSHARSCGESLQSQNRPISFFGTQLIFLWDEHWADPDLPQSSQRPFLLRMLALQWKNLQTTKEASPIRASANQGGAVQPFCGAVIPALLSPACFFEGSGRWGTRCTCQDYQLAFQNQASKAETHSQQPPKIKKPSRTVLMSPCRSYCEGTDIDAF